MSYAPASITAAAKVYVANGGVNLGIVGSLTTHCKGYHLGRDRIFSNCACRPNHKCSPGQHWNDYSVQLTRDKNGLSNAAMAFDAGRIDGSLPKLRAFTAWLFNQCRADTADTQDIREVIGTVNGTVVVNWLRDRGTASPPEVGGDSTHLIHTHISYYRDTEFRDKTALFRRYFATPEPPPTDTEDDDVTITLVKGEDWKAVNGNGVLRSAPVRAQNPIVRLPDGTVIRTIAEASTPDGNIWRLTEYQGKPAWALRIDWQPLVQGGDPATDAELTAYIARQ